MKSTIFFYILVSLLIVSCNLNQKQKKEAQANKIEETKHTFNETFGDLPNENSLLKGSWKIDSIQFSDKTKFPPKEAYIFKDTSAYYLRGDDRMVREDYVGIYRYYSDTLTFFIEKLSSGSNPQTWKLEYAKKSLVMHALYKTAKNESPILYLTKTNYDKLTFADE